MPQRIAYYCATIQIEGSQYVTPAYELPLRREFVEFVNQTLDECHFSARTRRQISLPFIWRHIQKHGSGSHASFTLESMVAGHAGTVHFRGLTDIEFHGD